MLNSHMKLIGYRSYQKTLHPSVHGGLLHTILCHIWLLTRKKHQNGILQHSVVIDALYRKLIRRIMYQQVLVQLLLRVVIVVISIGVVLQIYATTEHHWPTLKTIV